MKRLLKSSYTGADKTGIIYVNSDCRNIYRFVRSKEWMDSVGKILLPDKEFLEKLFSNGLIRFTWYDEIYKLRMFCFDYIYSFTHMYYKTPRQVVDMIVMLCNLNLLLIEKGLTLCNYHEGDVNLWGCVSIFCDLGGISPLNEDTLRLMFFRMFHVIQRYIFKDYYGKHWDYNDCNIRDDHPYFMQLFKENLHNLQLVDNAKNIYNEVINYFKIYQFNEKKIWCSYQENYHDVIERFEKKNFNEKEQAVYEFLIKYKNDNNLVLDIGCNKGSMSMISTLLGFDVMGIDIDEYSVALAYEFCKNHSLLKYKVHFLNCSLAQLFKNREECKSLIDLLAPTNRYKSDIVLCVAFMHHWCKKNKFENLVRCLSRLTLDKLIFEYIPGIIDIDNMLNIFEKYGFIKIDNMKSNVGRTMFVFQQTFKNFKLL